MNRISLRIATVVFAMGGLSACSAIQDSQILQPEFWSVGGNTVAENNEAELGLAELAKGDNVRALSHFDTALKINPNDVHALYGAAVMYQNAGQPAMARQYYEQILTMQPAPREEVLIWADKQTHPIVDIAQVNVQLLQDGAMAPLPGAPLPGVQQPGMQQPGVQQGTAQPRSQLYLQPQQQQQQAQADQPMFKNADLNIVARFNVMRTLLAEGLITEDEFIRRRQANLGALLPMTNQPPATGIDRPVPAAEQISGRLRAISRALEMRALTPAQHTSERSMILDALMPERPASVAYPAPPPRGLMAAADAVRRVEMFKQADLVTSDEYAKERAAIERAMQPVAPPPLAGAKAPAMSQGQSQGQSQGGSDATSNLSGFQPAVHLASYRQKGAAERGWAALVKRFSELSALKPSIERVDLGNTKGVFYRLKAGPLPSNGAAQNLCRKLKASRQYCEPSTINFG